MMACVCLLFLQTKLNRHTSVSYLVLALQISLPICSLHLIMIRFLISI
jgi:hypothetical protein